MRSICVVETCDKDSESGYRSGLCAMHRARQARHGSFEDPRPKPLRKRVKGYWAVLDPSHPLTMPATGYVAEHRMVLWEKLGPDAQPCHWCGRVVEWLTPHPDGLVVDHLDGSRDNNDPGNLVPSCSPCNVARDARARTQCAEGHDLTPENTLVLVKGNVTRRRCKTCNARRARERYHHLKSA